MRSNTFKEMTIMCIFFITVARYLWLQFDTAYYNVTSSKKNLHHYVMMNSSEWAKGVIEVTSAVSATESEPSDLQLLYSPLAAALLRVQDPAFIVYGNRGYRQLMGNFICNMALFPGMHSHILMIVTDDDTAAFLSTFSERITVFVAHQDLHEAYDFETAGYLKLMLARGLVLVDLLGIAQTQSKTIIWLEPDFFYTQNLLSRPEMTETISDLVFYWDHEMYCGCFIRFSPAPASLKFYKEVMDRMQTIHSNGGTTNDQILLNMVVADQLPNFTLFDRCLYRSGTFNTGGYMLEYQQACQGVLPVAQHHNWIVGANSKVQKAKESGGWFMSDDENSCRQRDLLLVVMTMNRAHSLKRLIHSVDTAQYIPGSTVDLRVTVDRDYSGGVDEETTNFLKSLQWGHGIFEVIVWPKKVGLYGQWVHAWPAELYPENFYKAVILLEDDLEVSPHYAQWFVGAHQAYGGVQGVGAITGQRPNLVAAVNGPESVAGQVPEGVKAFGYMLIATWSLSPKHTVWREFRQWVLDKRNNSPDFVPHVPGIVPNKWYEHFKLEGSEEDMWEMWFIRFMDERKLYTVYPWVEAGQRTIVGNWMEAGLHFSGAPSLDFPIASEWDADLLTQTSLPLVGYELKFGGLCVVGDLYGQFNNQLLIVSWAMMLARQSNMLLFLAYDNSDGGIYLKLNWEKIFGVVVGVSWVDKSSIVCSKEVSWKDVFNDMLNRRESVSITEWPIVMPIQSIRTQAADVWLKNYPGMKRRVTVHGRSFDGVDTQCVNSLHSAFQCSEHLCDYRLPEISNRFSDYLESDENIVLFTDGQNSQFINTYQFVDREASLEVQMWMMVMADVHIGHPGSSQDYVIWRWRQHINSNGVMLPWNCYNPVQSSTPLHFIWISPYLTVSGMDTNPGQIKAKQVALEWMNILPRGKYKLEFWTDKEVREKFPELVPTMSRISVQSWISDVLRYHIMLRYGGVYLDTDVLAVHDFTPLLNAFNSTFTVCQTPWTLPDSNAEITSDTPCESIITAIIAAPPHHPSLKCAAEHSLAYSVRTVSEGTQSNFVMPETGPPRWTSCVQAHKGMAVLPSWTFLACSFFSRGGCNKHDYSGFLNVYGMHEWLWSWEKQ